MSEKWKRFTQGSVTTIAVLFILLMVTKCSLAVREEIKQEKNDSLTRTQNDGALPGVELRGSDGTLYTIVTFHKRPDIECINGFKRMACYTK